MLGKREENAAHAVPTNSKHVRKTRAVFRALPLRAGARAFAFRDGKLQDCVAPGQGIRAQ
jgi:hypothetical protein